VVYKVVLPYTKAGVVGGIMLGLGRALGETMAVTFVIGNFNQLDSLSLFQAANSITSALANEFAEAASGLHQAALIYLGLVLFFITFVVLACPRCCWPNCARAKGPSHEHRYRRKPAAHGRPANRLREQKYNATQAGQPDRLTLSLAAMAFGLFWLAGFCGKPCAWGWAAWPGAVHPV
jgi:hypothetical protein